MKKLMFISIAMLISIAMIFSSCKKDTEDDTPAPSPKPTFTDPRDGQVYVIVEIGDQTWMAENLRATQYSEGTPIPEVEDSVAWSNLTNADKAYCRHDSVSTANVSKYGCLYNWAAAMNGANSSYTNPSAVQGVCPTGWHLPSDAEWKQLEMHLGMSQADANISGWRGDDEGCKMKEAGITHWQTPNCGATNECGFTALPGGCRYYGGSFGALGCYADFWSATEKENWSAWNRKLSYNDTKISRMDLDKKSGFSVRCVRD